MTRIYQRMVWPSVADANNVLARRQFLVPNPDYPATDPLHPYLPILLNGIYEPFISDKASISDHGMIRTVAIHQNDDTTGLSFRVAGYQNGIYLEDLLAGSASEILMGTLPYDYITSITIEETGVFNPVTNLISVGLGLSGFFVPIQVNTATNLSHVSYGINIIPEEDNDEVLVSAIYHTYEDIYKRRETLQNLYFNAQGDSELVLIENNIDEPFIYTSDAITNYLIIAINNEPDIQETNNLSVKAFYMQL